MDGEGEEFFLTWGEAFHAGIKKVGGKGWNLSRLARYGFNVPTGGVLQAEAYKAFIRENDLEEVIERFAKVNICEATDEKELERELQKLRSRIEKGSFSGDLVEIIASQLKALGLNDKPLAVRSSASAEDSSEASFAGIHESFLNIKDLERIITAIKSCYASLWTLKALTYRRKMNIKDKEVIPSVIIMEMVNAEAAGIGFSCNPLSGRLDEIVINANYGLGESVVGGIVEPDQYLLEVTNTLPQLKNKIIGSKQSLTLPKEGGGTKLQDFSDLKGKLNLESQVLSDQLIVQLGLLILQVFESLGEVEHHQDIEWVYNGKKFFLVQARPVTIVPQYTYPALKNQPDIWSNANFKDALPMVITPFVRREMANWITAMLKAPNEMAGFPCLPGLQYVRYHNGRIYLNISLLQWEFFDSLGLTPNQTNAYAGGHQPEIKIQADYSSSKIRNFRNKLRLGKATMKVFKNADDIFREIRKFEDYWLKKDIKLLSNQELLNTFIERENTLKPFAKLHLLNSGAGLYLDILVNTLKKDFNQKAVSMANSLLLGKANITSAEHGYRLLELAEIAREDVKAKEFFLEEPFEPLAWERRIPASSPFMQRFREFLKEYGHRAVYELDIKNPRWWEDPTYLFEYIRSMVSVANLNQVKADQKLKGEKVWQEVKKAVPFYRRYILKRLVRLAIKGAEMRELGKSELVRGLQPLRVIALEVGRRLQAQELLVEQYDIFYCSISDIIAILLGWWDGTGLKLLVQDRKVRYKELETMTPADIIINGEVKYIDMVLENSDETISGLGVSAGKARGRAKLVFHPSEGLTQGEVLIAPSTDPAWTPLFLKATGVVMETGGFLSHGAIVAREYGIPAVVNVPGIMNHIKNGDELAIDGDEGKIYRTN